MYTGPKTELLLDEQMRQLLQGYYRNLLKLGRDPNEHVFVIYDATIEPGRSLLIASLQREGKSEEASRLEARRLIDACRGAQLRMVWIAKVTEAAAAIPELSVWLDSPCPYDRLRVVMNNGTHWLTYQLSTKTWTVLGSPSGSPFLN
jgi:hypothetical protein